MSPEVFLEFKQLTSAVFVERLNRFAVRCRLGDTDELVEAHLADPGRLKELLVLEPTYIYSPLINLDGRRNGLCY